MHTLLAVQNLLSHIERRLRPISRRQRLTSKDFLVLAWLGQQSMSGSLLGERVACSRQNMQRALRRLEARGYVESWDNDMTDRVIGWSLTPKGLAAWDRVRQEFLRIESVVFQTPQRAREVVEFLTGLKERITRATREGPWVKADVLGELPADVSGLATPR
jgi:DNA-binding MarR family transcriptional regulator